MGGSRSGLRSSCLVVERGQDTQLWGGPRRAPVGLLWPPQASKRLRRRSGARSSGLSSRRHPAGRRGGVVRQGRGHFQPAELLQQRRVEQERDAYWWNAENPQLWGGLNRAPEARASFRAARAALRGVRRSELSLQMVQGGRWGGVVRQGGGHFQPAATPAERATLHACTARGESAGAAAADGGGEGDAPPATEAVAAAEAPPCAAAVEEAEEEAARPSAPSAQRESAATSRCSARRWRWWRKRWRRGREGRGVGGGVGVGGGGGGAERRSGPGAWGDAGEGAPARPGGAATARSAPAAASAAARTRPP